MSFKCAYSNEVVQGDRQILIPSVIRKVIYRYSFPVKNRATGEQDLIFETQTEGYETVREVGVCEKNYPEFLKNFQPKLQGEKTVNVVRLKKREKIQYTPNVDNEEE